MIEMYNIYSCLKVPASVYVKKTSSGQQTIDISGLAAPTAESDKTKTDGHTEPSVNAATNPDQLVGGDGDGSRDLKLNSTEPGMYKVPHFHRGSLSNLLGKNIKLGRGPVKGISWLWGRILSWEMGKEISGEEYQAAGNFIHPCTELNPDLYPRLEEGRRLSSGSDMDCGSVTPSPRATPEHPGIQAAGTVSLSLFSDFHTCRK